MVNKIEKKTSSQIHELPDFYQFLENKKKELVPLIKLNKGSKGWLKQFDEISNLTELISYYEKQKVTFSGKKESYANNVYFFSFILAFLKFYPRLTDRSIEALGNLMKYLYNLDRDLFDLIWNNLPFDLRDRIIQKINYKIKILLLNTLSDVIDFYEDLRKKLSKPYIGEEIVGILISIFEKIIEFHNEWNDFPEKKIYSLLLSLERNILRYSTKYGLNINFDVKKYLQEEDYEKYVKFSISFKNGIPRWQDYFDSLSIDGLISFYNKQKATFSRKVKSKDIVFFQEFIKAFKKYKDVAPEKVVPKLQILINWYSKLDLDYKDFLGSIGLDYNELYSYFNSDNTLEKRKTERKNKNNLEKEKNIRKNVKSKKKLKLENQDSPQFTFEIILTNLKNKIGKNLEGKSWYDVGVERLKNYLQARSISEVEFENIISLLKIEDLYSISDFWPKSKKVKVMILNKTLDDVNILFLPKEYFSVFDNLLKEFMKKNKNFNKDNGLYKKLLSALNKNYDLRKFLEDKYPGLFNS